MSSTVRDDPRRSNKIHRYKPPEAVSDALIEMINLFGLILTIGGLWLESKFCAWTAVLCSLISVTNARASDDTKQLITMAGFSISVLIATYYHNPAPLSLLS